MGVRSLLRQVSTPRSFEGMAAQPSAEETPTDRRRMLKVLGATAAGAVGATLIEASPVAATQGSAVLAGETNTATADTVVSTNSANGLRGFSSDDTAAGLYGVDPDISGLASGIYPTGVVGDSSAGYGVVGVSAGAAGVYGNSTAGDGVSGETNSDGANGTLGRDFSEGGGSGVYGFSENGYGLGGSGGLAQLILSPRPSPGAPTSGDHQLGEVYVDENGVFYRCVVAGTPGTWVPQYSVVPLAAPVRVINTTNGTSGLTGPFTANGDTHTTGVLTGGPTGIPDIAVGVVGNLTISGNGETLNGDGYLTLFPAGASNPDTSSLNAGGDAFATSNGVTIAFGTGENAGMLSFSWQGGGSPLPCQVFLDVTAYIL